MDRAPSLRPRCRFYEAQEKGALRLLFYKHAAPTMLNIAAYDAENHLTSLEYADNDGVVPRTEYAYSGDDFLTVVKQYEDDTLVDETRILGGSVGVIQKQ